MLKIMDPVHIPNRMRKNHAAMCRVLYENLSKAGVEGRFKICYFKAVHRNGNTEEFSVTGASGTMLMVRCRPGDNGTNWKINLSSSEEEVRKAYEKLTNPREEVELSDQPATPGEKPPVSPLSARLRVPPNIVAKLGKTMEEPAKRQTPKTLPEVPAVHEPENPAPEPEKPALLLKLPKAFIKDHLLTAFIAAYDCIKEGRNGSVEISMYIRECFGLARTVNLANVMSAMRRRGWLVPDDTDDRSNGFGWIITQAGMAVVNKEGALKESPPVPQPPVTFPPLPPPPPPPLPKAVIPDIAHRASGDAEPIPQERLRPVSIDRIGSMSKEASDAGAIACLVASYEEIVLTKEKVLVEHAEKQKRSEEQLRQKEAELADLARAVDLIRKEQIANRQRRAAAEVALLTDEAYKRAKEVIAQIRTVLG